jgi:uncharacterized integral membrane protein
MSDKTPSTGGSRKLDNHQIFTLLAVVLLTWFAVSNWQSVEIHFWVTSAKAPLFIVILVAAVLGGVVVRLAARMRRPRKHRGD